LRVFPTRCEICAGLSGCGEGFRPSTWISPISIIPSVLHTHQHINTTTIRRTSGWRLGIFMRSGAVWITR